MKEVFSRNENIHVTAFMNWRIEDHTPILNMINIGDGFLQSAIILAEDAILDNTWKKADIVIFPILTNANHGIELYLKGLITILNQLLKNELKTEGGHNTQQLFKTVQARIKEYKGDKWLADFNSQNGSLIEYISELFTLIESESKKDKMDFSRYPISSKGENHFYVEEIRNVVVDLPNFIERFKSIHEALEERSDYFYHQELMGDRENY